MEEKAAERERECCKMKIRMVERAKEKLGPVVSMRAFYSDDSCSKSAEVYVLTVK